MYGAHKQTNKRQQMQNQCVDNRNRNNNKKLLLFHQQNKI